MIQLHDTFQLSVIHCQAVHKKTFWTLSDTVTVVNLYLSLFLHTTWWRLFESRNVYMDLGFIPLKCKLCSTGMVDYFNGIYITFFCILLFLNFVSHCKIHKIFALNVLPPPIISLLYNLRVWYCDQHLRTMYLKTIPSETFRKCSIFIRTCTIYLFSVGGNCFDVFNICGSEHHAL